jgi:WD40 repeat protein
MAVEEAVAVELPNGLSLAQTLRAQAGNINEIAWSPTGRELASGDPDGRIGVWDVVSGAQRTRLERGEKLVWSVAWSPNGDRLASGTNEGSITIYHAESGEPMETFGNHASWVRSVAWSPAGDCLASGANDTRVILWDLESGERRRVLEGHRDRVLSVRFSPDGQLLASAGGDGFVIVWRLEDGEPIARHHLKNGWQRSVCFSPDSRLVAAGGEDGAVRLLRVADGRLAGVLEGHREGVGCVTFDASGRILASRSVDGRVRLWSPHRGTWRLLARFKASASFPMANMAFHPTQPALATVDLSRIRIWQLDLEKLRHSADGLPTTPVHVAKVALLGRGGGDLIDTLHAQSVDHPLLPALEAAAIRVSSPPVCHLLASAEQARKPERRDLVLWDLSAGPADLELQLRDVALAIVAIDLDAADPGAELRAIAARVARVARRQGATPPLLLAHLPRIWPAPLPACDLAGCELPLAGIFPLQRLTHLRELVHELLGDAGFQTLGSAAALRDVEAVLDDELAAGRWVGTADDLLRQVLGRDVAPGADEARRPHFEAALRQLELRGRIRQLRPGPLVVARGLVEVYAGALRQLAADDPRGVGAIAEAVALDAPLALPPALRLDGQLDDVLRLGVLRELCEAGLAFRAPLGGVPHYCFPELFGRGREALPGAAPTLALLELGGEGPLALATAVLRLSDGHAFELAAVHALGARLRSPLGGEFTISQTGAVPSTGATRLELAGESSPDLARLFVETAVAELERAGLGPVRRLDAAGAATTVLRLAR